MVQPCRVPRGSESCGGNSQQLNTQRTAETVSEGSHMTPPWAAPRVPQIPTPSSSRSSASPSMRCISGNGWRNASCQKQCWSNSTWPEKNQLSPPPPPSWQWKALPAQLLLPPPPAPPSPPSPPSPYTIVFVKDGGRGEENPAHTHSLCREREPEKLEVAAWSSPSSTRTQNLALWLWYTSTTTGHTKYLYCNHSITHGLVCLLFYLVYKYHGILLLIIAYRTLL